MALIARASSLLSQCTHRESWAQGQCECEMLSRMYAVVLSTHAGLTRGAVRGTSDVWLCTCNLRLIQLPDKPGKIPSFQHVYEGVLPWYRIFSSTSLR
jgi:hypothetical protein